MSALAEKLSLKREAAQTEPVRQTNEVKSLELTEEPERTGSHRVHLDHEAERRDVDTVHELYDESWAPPKKTDAPKPLPGYGQRWVRTHIMGQYDPRNVYEAQREGWQIRTASSLSLGEVYHKPENADFGDVISCGDGILMQRSQQRNDAEIRYFRKESERRVRNISQFLQKGQNAPAATYNAEGTKLADRKETVDVQRGRLPRVAEDEVA